MSGPDTSAGLFGSLRRLLHSSLEVVQVRLRLLGTELEEEKLRLTGGLLLACVGLLLLGIGLLLMCVLIVLWVAPAHRLAALGLLTALFLGAALWLLYRASQQLRNPGGLFQGSLAELAKDRDALAPRE